MYNTLYTCTVGFIYTNKSKNLYMTKTLLYVWYKNPPISVVQKPSYMCGTKTLLCVWYKNPPISVVQKPSYMCGVINFQKTVILCPNRL